ncbi:hypothetical protein D7V80_05170 [Corallococcus sp. CA054B]|uniref:hypothetical protein n=1 Tax=Corallococcus sp. CA054B TaxID=2316734 RepID=UPI000EA34483|nr:hypothetical protein [Corallococcus sp. CA054B]RKG70415.1 hypothetical protein D7V80_05170 [Corallococcus sp. CA054B]
MVHAPVLLAALVLAGAAPVPDEAALWKAIFSLEQPVPATRASAEAALLSGGATAYGVLSKVARVGGMAQALAATGPVTSCGLIAEQRFLGKRSEHGSLSARAADLLGRMLAEDAALRQRAQRSEDPFDRALALAASARAPATQPEALAAMRLEPVPKLRLWATSFAECFTRQAEKREDGSAEALGAAASELAELADAVREPLRCVEPAELEPVLVDELIKGLATSAGWAGSLEAMTVYVRRENGERVELSPACAMAAYEAAAAKGTYDDGLLKPLATDLQGDWKLRQVAGQRLARDLGHLKEAQRNRLAAELVNAGHDVPWKVTFDRRRLAWSRVELEAAVRQGNPEARATINKLLQCRHDTDQRDVALLGYLRTKAAADKAYELARQCPEGKAAAVAALIRMKDPRALGLLPQAMEDWGFDQEALKRALLEGYTPKLGELLKALAAKGSPQAQSAVQLLTAASVMKP